MAERATIPMRRGLILLGLLTILGLSGGAAAAQGAPVILAPAERTTIFESLRGGDEIGRSPAASLSDTALWTALVRHATVELAQRVRPSSVDELWAIDPPRRQVESEIEAARAQGQLAAWIAVLPVANPRYRALLPVRDHYRAIVASGGWPEMPGGPTLRLGAVGPAVAVLRSRLGVEGYLSARLPGDTLDAAVGAALVDFQSHHDLQPDGSVGPATREALNVPAAQRLAQIEATLERWRWIRSFPPNRIEVDVGAAEATLYVGDVAQLPMRIIVGDPKHKTPMFISRMSSVVFNPPWIVPASIDVKELSPKERAHPGYFAANGFSRVDGVLQQAPGPKNSLGQVKFDFPSPFGVYLHDTPARSLFARPVRTLSHGCMRVEKPRELAAALLGTQGWTRERVDTAIAAASTQRVQLSQTTPLFVFYQTVAVRDDGSLQFHPDTYGWDAKLMMALGAKDAVISAIPHPETECGAPKSP